MKHSEKEMVGLLADLRENHHAVGLKTEFEDEGTRLEELQRLKEYSTSAALELTVKIGGCGALRDMCEAQAIGVSRIVAPMIESPYALSKFLRMAGQVFASDESVTLCMNVETIDAYEAFDRMLAVPEIDRLTGIVVGRVDLAGSLGLNREQIDSRKIFGLVIEIFTKAKELSLECAIGGGIAPVALPFLRKLPVGLIDRFETRNVIFKCPDALGDGAEEHIRKAVQFELMWLRYKRNFYEGISRRDDQRIVMLETRYE